MQAHFNHMSYADAVCLLIGTQPGDFGNGVFVSPDTVFTAAHVVVNAGTIQAYNVAGQTAKLLPETKIMLEGQDLALIKLDKPLFDRNMPFVTNGEGLGHRGILATRFNHESSPLEQTSLLCAQYAPAYKSMDDLSAPVRMVRTFRTEKVGPGYSGSPIFNENGEIASVVSAAKKKYGPLEDKETTLLHPDGHFFLIEPAIVADFLRKNLG